MNTVGKLGEHAVIERLVSSLGTHADLRVGAGDDCAVTSIPGTGTDQVFTSDPLIEKIHFLPGEQPDRIGHKAAGRVFSDLAAMGARPQWLLVNVVAPPELEMETLEKIYTGIHALCHRFGATLIGGDLAEGACLELHLFGTGILPTGTALLRSNAQAGDAIFTTGSLGDSLKGKHLDFVPRVEEGLFLRETDRVHAMIDLSDGLATDLRHLLQASGMGAVLDANAIPKNKTLEKALYDGEDFELLFTVGEENRIPLQTQWAERFDLTLSKIGHITAKKNELFIRSDSGIIEVLEGKAFEHFK